MRKPLLWDIGGTFLDRFLFHLRQEFAHAGTVVALQDDRHEVTEDGIGHHDPTQRHAVPQEEENAGQDHYPVADFRPHAFLQPAFQVGRITGRQVLDRKRAVVERGAIGNQVFPGAHMKYCRPVPR